MCIYWCSRIWSKSQLNDENGQKNNGRSSANKIKKFELHQKCKWDLKKGDHCFYPTNKRKPGNLQNHNFSWIRQRAKFTGQPSSLKPKGRETERLQCKWVRRIQLKFLTNYKPSTGQHRSIESLGADTRGLRPIHKLSPQTFFRCSQEKLGGRWGTRQSCP